MLVLVWCPTQGSQKVFHQILRIGLGWDGFSARIKQVFTFAATNWRHMEIFGRISSAALPEVFLQIDLDLKLHSLPAT